MRKYLFILLAILILTGLLTAKSNLISKDDPRILSYKLNPTQMDLKFYWKDDKGNTYGNFQNLKSALAEKGQKLIFAMNGGMYNKDSSPQGLFIENGEIKAQIDTIETGYGNFYLQPNGIFYLDAQNMPAICTTTAFDKKTKINYATQSGPMLLIDGKIHPKFTQGSSNLHIRNGVGILPNGNILFAISKERINFFDFATFFKDNGCKNALYLDGFVSRAYIPSKNWEQLDGNFGVIIAVTEPMH